MSRSASEPIPLSPDERAACLERERDQMREWLSAATAGSALTVRRLQGPLLRRGTPEAKLASAKIPASTLKPPARLLVHRLFSCAIW